MKITLLALLLSFRAFAGPQALVNQCYLYMVRPPEMRSFDCACDGRNVYLRMKSEAAFKEDLAVRILEDYVIGAAQIGQRAYVYSYRPFSKQVAVTRITRIGLTTEEIGKEDSRDILKKMRGFGWEGMGK